MIHILTLHFATPAWLEIQKRHLLKFTSLPEEEYKVWLGLYHLDLPEDFELPSNWEIINLDKDYPPEGKNEHYLQMEWMYHNRLKDQMCDDDIIIFMDSDAFPCAPAWAQDIQRLITQEGRDVICLHQEENRGIAALDEYHPYPDLCFFVATKKAWEEHNLEWGLFNPAHQNPGFGMKDRLVAALPNINIGAISRTNRFNAHNVMFGVYGGTIYHQACGSRAIIGRPVATPGAPADIRRHCFTGADLYLRQNIANWFENEFETDAADIIETNTQIFDIIFNKIQKDKECTFIRRYFMGLP